MTYWTTSGCFSDKDPQGNVTASAYDAAGRLTQTTDPSHNTTQYQYDAVGNTVALTGGTAGAATTVETRAYDARNEVATDTTSGPGLTTALTTRTYYDGDGNVAQVQQPNGDVTYNTYDFADELRTVEVDPAPVGKGGAPGQPRVDSYTYDAAGNQVTHLDADNRTDTTTPDAANRTVQDVATVPGSGGTAATGTVITTTTSFDPDGNTVSWTRQTQTQTGPVQTQTDSATFDAADRQTSSTDNGLTTAYGYDAAGQQRTHTIADGATTVTTSLDPAGRQTGISEGMGGSGPYTGRTGYNANDLPVTMTLPGGSGVQEAMGYDASSRLVTQTLAGPTSNTPIGGSIDSYDSYNMDGSKITTGPQGGQITSISAYVGAIDPTPANDIFQVAFYTDSSSAPGTLVASSASGTLVANGWNTVANGWNTVANGWNTVALAATLAPTTTYWLLYNATGSAPQYDNLAYDTGPAGSGAYYSAANQSLSFQRPNRDAADEAARGEGEDDQDGDDGEHDADVLRAVVSRELALRHRHHHRQRLLLVVEDDDQRFQEAVPRPDEQEDAQGGEGGGQQGQHQAVEHAQLARPVDAPRLQQLLGYRRVADLLQEEDGERIGDRGHDQRPVGIEQLERGHRLEETDDAQLSGDHHRDQHEREQDGASLKGIFGEAEPGQRGEVEGQGRGGGRDQQAVQEAPPDVDHADQPVIVVKERAPRQQREPRCDGVAVVGRGDHHAVEWQHTQQSQRGQGDIDRGVGHARATASPRPRGGASTVRGYLHSPSPTQSGLARVNLNVANDSTAISTKAA